MDVICVNYLIFYFVLVKVNREEQKICVDSLIEVIICVVIYNHI